MCCISLGTNPLWRLSSPSLNKPGASASVSQPKMSLSKAGFSDIDSGTGGGLLEQHRTLSNAALSNAAMSNAAQGSADIASFGLSEQMNEGEAGHYTGTGEAET